MINKYEFGIPFETDAFSVNGLQMMMEFVSKIETKYRMCELPYGCLVTKLKSNKNNYNLVTDLMEKEDILAQMSR